MTTRLFNPLSDYLKEQFGGRTFKVTVDAGFTCPNRDGAKGRDGCLYCKPETLVPQYIEDKEDIESQIKRGVEIVRKRHNAEKFIAYFQVHTNTYAEPSRLKDLYSRALKFPEVAAIAVSTRPDCLSEDVLAVLQDIKEKKHLWLELGLQSANNPTLEAMNRGHSAEDFKDALLRARERGIDVCAHVILGLPGEKRGHMLDTIGFLNSIRPWGIKFHQLQVLKDTPLESLYNNREVVTLKLDEYATLVVECLERLSPEVVVHRLCGDTPERHLVAPRWSGNKLMVIEKILAKLRTRKSYQGMRFGLTDNGKIQA